MKTSADLARQNVIDLSDEIIIANPIYTPLTSLLFSRNKTTKAKDVVVRRKIKKLSTAVSGGRKEGADAPEAEKTSYEWIDNNLEIFTKSTVISGTVGAIEGDTKQALAKEISDRLVELKGDIERAFFVGVKKDEDETGGRQMAGLINQVHVDHIIDVGAAALERKHINQAMQKLFTAQIAGEKYIFVNPADIDTVTDLYEKTSETIISLTPGNTEVGITVTAINTNFGKANIVLANDVPAGTLLFASLDYIEVPVLRAPEYEPLAKTGDADKGQVVAELSIIAAPQSLAKIVNFV